LSGESVDYTINIIIRITGAQARYEETHTRTFATDYRCRVEPLEDGLRLVATASNEAGGEVPARPLCTIREKGGRYYFQPLDGSHFSYVEPLPKDGLLMKRSANSGRE